MPLPPVVLEGRLVRLVPLRPDHFEALYRQADRDVFEHGIDWPADDSFAAFARWQGRLLDREDVLPFAVIAAASGAPVGVTTFLGHRPHDRAIEIGATWYGPAARGSGINAEAKLLLLRHAFGTLGVRRVQLKTSSENRRSQRALEKLGAVREGVLRKFQVRANGVSRDTVMYSITDDDWPRVEAALVARLAGAGG